jgi:hypothetical protein
VEQSRVHLLTEGEAILHCCVTNAIAPNILSPTIIDASNYFDDADDQSDSQGVIVIEAGDRTIDLSAFSMKLSPTSFEEIAPAECESLFLVFSLAEGLSGSLQGSDFVTSRARTLLQSS